MMSSLVQCIRRLSLSSLKNVQCLFFNQLSAFAVHSKVLSCSFCQHHKDILLYKINIFLLYCIFLNELLSVLSVMFSRMLRYIFLSFTLITHLLCCFNES